MCVIDGARSAAVLQVHSEKNSYLSVWPLAL